jgi:hypothetical protein
MTRIVKASEIKNNMHYDCIEFDINSKYFIYDPVVKIVCENFDDLTKMNVDFDYYVVSCSDSNSKLLQDMKKLSSIKLNFSNKAIGASPFISDYISFQYIITTMNKDDYLNLHNEDIRNKYEGKYVLMHDELPHLDNFEYIKDLVGYEIDCVHLNANSDYFRYDSKNNELYECDELYNPRRQILSYILDINISDYSDKIKLEHGNKFKCVNVVPK